MAQTQLTLVVPGLLGPFRGEPGRAVPQAPALLSLLNRATSVPESIQDPLDWLFPRFGIEKPPQGDWPAAPIAARFETDLSADGYWLCADPVHLRADRSRLVLFGPEALAIRQAEADALVQAFNELYQADGWQLFAPSPQRWYLRLPEAPQLHTTPLAQVIGRDIDAHLPRGADARRWHARLNEIQMLLHGHAVNQQRSAQGRPAINSLWLWGGGRLPARLQPQDRWGYSDGVLASGLFQAAGISVTRTAEDPQRWLAELLPRGAGLVLLEGCQRALQYGDYDAWLQAHAELEQQWWQPLLQLRARQQLTSCTLHPCAGTAYQLGKRRWREGWRRHRGWDTYLVSAG